MTDAENTHDNEDRYLNYLEEPANTDEIATDEMLAGNDKRHLIRHNENYTKLLSCYVNNIAKTLKAKYYFKIIFFGVVMLAIVSVIVMFVWSLICALECEGLEAAAVAVIGSFVSIISATIVLPSIIAKYLFNLDEEKDAVEIIKGMQEFDKTTRKHND